MSTALSQSLCEQIDQALETERQQESPRHYLGASSLGKACSRALQFDYLHIPVDPGKHISGKVMRTFAAGHVFESLLVKWLRLAGFELYTEKEGKPFGFWALNGKFQGHVDGVLASGPKSAQGAYPALWEAKSLKASSWRDTQKRGVTLSKPIYAAQIALYQAYMANSIPGIEKHPALFTAINKDTSELYFEWVPFNGELAQRTSDRAVNIIEACEGGEWLPRISRDESHYECRFCPWRTRCWRQMH